MLTVKKAVHYCEHCKKHGLSSHAMAKHERHCVRNPERTCRWGGLHEFNAGLVETVADFEFPLAESDIEWLRERTNKCPACMLGVLLQAGVKFPVHGDRNLLWSYDDEVAAWKERERESWRDEAPW